MKKFTSNDMYKNPSVPLLSQFIQYIQNGLTKLDEALLTYTSSVYKSCPFKVRSYLNGKKLVVKNTEHPLYDKWDSLISRTHHDPAYATTRITFSWKGFYMPKGKVNNVRDKYAFLHLCTQLISFSGRYHCGQPSSRLNINWTKKILFDIIRSTTLDG
jgi:hypothetical protein